MRTRTFNPAIQRGFQRARVPAHKPGFSATNPSLTEKSRFGTSKLSSRSTFIRRSSSTPPEHPAEITRTRPVERSDTSHLKGWPKYKKILADFFSPYYGKRGLTLWVGVPAVLSAYGFLPNAAVIGIVLTLTAGSLIEYFDLVLPNEKKKQNMAFGILTGMAIAVSQLGSSSFAPTLFLGFAGAALYSLFSYRPDQKVTEHTEEHKKAESVLRKNAVGMVYIGFLLSHLHLIHNIPNGVFWAITAFAITAAGDTMAYSFGRAFGKKKLMPNISPGKTVMGFIGQNIGPALVGALMINRFAPAEISPHLIDIFALYLFGGPLGAMADLVQSQLKRSYDVKDTGRREIFPGMGGFMDRLDSLSFVVPATYYWATQWREPTIQFLQSIF